ncbi:YdcH family protein [Riemerella columbina]|uniref:YdcH family protein n=1 Tax=Riemerella columbina TaxID=103810 RepID=UPI00266F69D6|nr:DUF465 domain-containing protein [Riemerella columbina]WKS94369.1 DUF465 domain-containing protein [Riemerella columbina]
MENHILANEFPEFVQLMTTLKTSDNHFKRLFEDYDEVNGKIKHYEAGEQNHTTDEFLTELRKERLHLKDEIYNYLKSK